MRRNNELTTTAIASGQNGSSNRTAKKFRWDSAQMAFFNDGWVKRASPCAHTHTQPHTQTHIHRRANTNTVISTHRSPFHTAQLILDGLSCTVHGYHFCSIHHSGETHFVECWFRRCKHSCALGLFDRFGKSVRSFRLKESFVDFSLLQKENGKEENFCLLRFSCAVFFKWLEWDFQATLGNICRRQWFVFEWSFGLR